MRRCAAAILAFLSACGPEPTVVAEGADENQIRRVSTPVPAGDAAAAAVRLQPLTVADIDNSGARDAGCRFAREGRILVATIGGDAIARPGGTLRHFVQSAPVGETGAFLEDRQLSISIGRIEPKGAAARITVTDRRRGTQERWAGTWSCVE